MQAEWMNACFTQQKRFDYGGLLFSFSPKEREKMQLYNGFWGVLWFMKQPQQ